MPSEGHIGLSNEKREEIAVGDFQIALSYLKKDERTAYFVIHIYSNIFDYSPYLQRSNIRPNERKDFLERLGFKFSSTCNIFSGGRCYFQVIEEVDRDARRTGRIDEMMWANAIHDRFRKFASKVDDLFRDMRNIDQRLLDAGFELPWDKLKLAPVVISKDEKVYPKDFVYDFYKDIRDITQTAKNEIFVIDPYANEELIDLYLEKIPATVRIRILTNKPQGNFMAVAQKFQQKPGISFEVRANLDCHDRLYFIDNSCWVTGQSAKDAGKKPTYLVRIESHDLFRRVFEDLWNSGKKLL